MISTKSAPLLIVVALLGWIALVRPQIAKFANLALETRVVKAENNSYQDRLDQLAKIKQEGPALANVIKALFLAMPKSAQLPELLVMVESLASGVGISLANVSIGNPSAGEVPVSFTFSGSEQELTSFIDILSKNIRTVKIKGQTLSADAAGRLTINIQTGFVYQGN